MSTLLSISIALLAGLLMTRVFKPLRLPSVTAYLIAGILIGPYCIGKLSIDGIGFSSMDSVFNLSLVSEVALVEDNETKVEISRHEGKKCERCWSYHHSLEEIEGSCVCPRCKKVLDDGKFF